MVIPAAVSMLLRSSRGAFKVHLGALGKAEAFAKVSAKPGVFASPLARGSCFGRVDSILWSGYHFHTKILNHRDSDVKFSPFFPQIRLHRYVGVQVTLWTFQVGWEWLISLQSKQHHREQDRPVLRPPWGHVAMWGAVVASLRDPQPHPISLASLSDLSSFL